MKIVSNTFGLTAIINGKSFLVDLQMISGSLHQFYDKSSKVFNPDWTKGSQPSFKMAVRDTEGTEYEVKEAELYYQGSKISFGSNGISTTDLPVVGAFKREQIAKAGTTPAYRKFTIVKNLASDSNTDNDYISIEGTVITEGNNTQTLKTGNIPINIIQTASGGVSYFMSISAPPITTEGGSTKLVAHLFSSDTSGEVNITSRADGKWEKFDGSKTPGSQWVTVSGTSSELEVNDDDIDGCEMYRFSIKPEAGGAESTRVYAVTSVLDQTDNLFCELDCSGTAVPWKVNKGETAKITAKIVDKDGNEQTGTGLVATIKLVKADGSSNDNDVYTGSLSINYDSLVKTYGGSLTGYVSFEKPKTT